MIKKHDRTLKKTIAAIKETCINDDDSTRKDLKLKIMNT